MVLAVSWLLKSVLGRKNIPTAILAAVGLCPVPSTWALKKL